jgi:O-methyltransferase involved in polyketide biosynthesis
MQSRVPAKVRGLPEYVAPKKALFGRGDILVNASFLAPHDGDAKAITLDGERQVFKTSTLDGLSAEPTATRRTVAIDLRDDWVAALIAAGFDPNVPTAWIAEGLLIYLPPEAQDRLFDNITALSASGSRLATEQMDMSKLPADWAQQLTDRSRLGGSTIDLASLFYTGERNTAGDYLTTHGWDVTIRTGEEAFEANGFAMPDNGLAQLASSAGYLTATLK